MAKHSKTPWHFDYPEYDPSNVIIWQDDAENRICFMAHDGTDGNERGIANAAFIVRAVNCRDELVQMLEEAAQRFDWAANDDGSNSSTREGCRNKANAIRALLAKARGEAP